MLDSKPLHKEQNETGLGVYEATQPIALPFRLYLRICQAKKKHNKLFYTSRSLPITFFLS